MEDPADVVLPYCRWNIVNNQLIIGFSVIVSQFFSADGQKAILIENHLA